MQEITEIVCRESGLKLSQLMSKSRERYLVLNRFICYHLIKKKYPCATLKQIAGVFGKDHSSVIHGLRDIDNLLRLPNNIETKEFIARCEEKVFAYEWEAKS